MLVFDTPKDNSKMGEAKRRIIDTVQQTVTKKCPAKGTAKWENGDGNLMPVAKAPYLTTHASYWGMSKASRMTTRQGLEWGRAALGDIEQKTMTASWIVMLGTKQSDEGFLYVMKRAENSASASWS